ncbi:hypothetical protein K788_0003233 [Paraburkholderia caribensis MBA4]|uniref:Uncharacterized protein n=1 Tax=Paraburkholderia caribensis MBA4 TaxID=1323664 RepID=A0A0N7JUI3_9BURK|nr:hypothetical protein K788_0003233 [Paraburkholderia caribensis MBA4]
MRLAKSPPGISKYSPEPRVPALDTAIPVDSFCVRSAPHSVSRPGTLNILA